MATEQFPELAQAIVPVESLMDLSSELSKLFVSGLDSEDRELVQRVIKFSVWSAAQAKNEQFVHFLHDLLRNIIESDRRRAALWRHLDQDQFSKLKPYFVDGMRGSRITMRDLEMEHRFSR